MSPFFLEGLAKRVALGRRRILRTFVAGGSWAIGRPLIAELVRRGHSVTGMTRSDAGARALADLGAAVARVSAFEATGLEEALRRSRAEVVIDELTALVCRSDARWRLHAARVGREVRSRQGWFLGRLGVGSGSGVIAVASWVWCAELV